MEHTPLLRLRITFDIGGPLVYASVLDMGRMWERLMRRAGTPLAYTQGFSPHPRIQFASPLPVGYSSECEVVDVWLEHQVALHDVLRAIRLQSPAGLTIREVTEVPLAAPFPQATLLAAEYAVTIETPATASEIEAAIARLLAEDTVERRRVRKKGELQEYDLRPLIRDVRYVGAEGQGHRLWMDLQCGPQGSGRPEEVVGALDVGASHVVIHRTRLSWGEREENLA